tara:strand:- start:1762 stop:2181 length:420 start_codon:yes stop_codon:yes gene_type:complete
MAKLQQNILIRTDLGFSRGLISVQVAHIHAEMLRQNILFNNKLVLEPVDGFEGGTDETFIEWLKDPYIAVLGVPNLETLDHLIAESESAELVVNKWRDKVYCEIASDWTLTFDTIVGASVGPADCDDLKMIMGKLPLLQ